MILFMYGRPFDQFTKVWVYAPTVFTSLSETEACESQDVRKLIEEHRSSIERELGCAFEFTQDLNVDGAKWFIGPQDCNPFFPKINYEKALGPTLFLDRNTGLLVSDGSTPSEVTDTYSYLRSLGKFQGGLWKISECENIDEAILRVYEEVKNSYPSFKFRDLNWDDISKHHMPLVKKTNHPIAAFQSWLAELHDAHTWVRPFPPFGHFPYDLVLRNNSLLFYQVSPDSEAWKNGVRPGFALLENNIDEWTQRTAASEHSKPFVIGARLLSTELGKVRGFSAESPEGKIIEWSESPTNNRWNPLIEWKKLPSGNGYLKIRAWLTGQNFEEKINHIFQELKDAPKLIVDLRSNPGGNLLLSHHFRNRFLKEDTEDTIIGWIQNTLPSGELSEREAILGKAAPLNERWERQVVFLTDPLTYSASEDAILGLQGKSHVKVIGMNSGGGSGRSRQLKLLPGWRLTVSTSLTFDLAGNCIEGKGIPVDYEFTLSFDQNFLIEKADQLNW